MLMPPAALRWRMAWAMTGVGVSRLHRSGFEAVGGEHFGGSQGKFAPRNRVS